MDGVCVTDVPGCMDSDASNYNSLATVDDGSCFSTCQDRMACNFEGAGACVYPGDADSDAACTLTGEGGRAFLITKKVDGDMSNNQLGVASLSHGTTWGSALNECAGFSDDDSTVLSSFSFYKVDADDNWLHCHKSGAHSTAIVSSLWSSISYEVKEVCPPATSLIQGDACVAECDPYFAANADDVCVRGSCPDDQQLQFDLTCKDKVDCVWSHVPSAADCDARCGTISAVKTVDEAYGGTCAQQPTYVCSHGDGACSDGQADAWEECARLKTVYDEAQWVVEGGNAHRAEGNEVGAACCLDNPADDCLEWSQEYQRLACCDGQTPCSKVSCKPGYKVAGDECDQRCELIECKRHDSDGIYEYCLDDSWTDGDSVDDCDKKRVVSWKKDEVDWVEMEKKGAIRAACLLDDMGGCQRWFDGCNECTVSSDGGLPSCTEKYCSVYAEPKCND